MKIFDNANVVNLCNSNGIKSKKKKCQWKMSDSLRKQVDSMAKRDAENGIYMDAKFIYLQKSEVKKVAPDRAGLIRKLSGTVCTGNFQKALGSGTNWLCVLLGIPYKVEQHRTGIGAATHVYNENGEEILTYTGGVGWHAKETQEECRVYASMTMEYYFAYHSARELIKNGESTEITNEERDNHSNKFDVQA